MNFRHLKYFLTVAEELNITRAAERLYISQQSLSNHIGNMERELGVKLFTRSPKLSLTYAGELLVGTATQILELQSQYMSKVGDINRQYMGVLRVGVSHTCGLALLPDLLPKFHKEFPLVEFSLYEGNSTQLEDALAHGRTDLIICFQPITIKDVVTVPLTEQRLVLVVPKNFTDRRFGDSAPDIRERFSRKADISAFQGEPFVLIKRGNRTRSIVDQYFSRYYFKPNLILETENTVTTLAMAQAGVGATICPELFLRALPAPTPGAPGWTCSPSPTRPPSAPWWPAIGRAASCPTSASGSFSWPRRPCPSPTPCRSWSRESPYARPARRSIRRAGLSLFLCFFSFSGSQPRRRTWPPCPPPPGRRRRWPGCTPSPWARCPRAGQ